MCITVFYLEVIHYITITCNAKLVVCLFTTEHPELLKATTERIKTIIEHLKVTTEHIFFITIQEFLISC